MISDSELIKISYGDTNIAATRAEVRAAARDGLTVYDAETGEPYQLAAIYRGWCTLVTRSGLIFHSWAGSFTLARMEGVRA